jgi:hypothetical protein
MTQVQPEFWVQLAGQVTASLDLMTSALDRTNEALERERRWREKQASIIRQIPFTGAITISGGIGTLDQPDAYQAKAGFIWDIRRLTILGFSAGEVIAYRNGYMNPATGLNPGEQLCPFPAQATNTFSKASQLLMPTDRVCFGATGITLAAGSGQITVNGVATCFESWYLPYYLG